MATMSVADHYESHLGPIYSWMIGDMDAAFARSDLELESLGLPAAGTAIDLGAGFGLHALPLARRGFSVIALDAYQPLLDELQIAGRLPAHPHRQSESARLPRTHRTPDGRDPVHGRYAHPSAGYRLGRVAFHRCGREPQGRRDIRGDVSRLCLGAVAGRRALHPGSRR